MFTLISQTKSLFMAGCISYFESFGSMPEIKDRDTLSEEIRKFSKQQRKDFLQKIIQETGEGNKESLQKMLDISLTRLRELAKSENIKFSALLPNDFRMLQIVSNVILRKKGMEPVDSSLDGVFGPGSMNDYRKASGLFPDTTAEKTDKEILEALISTVSNTSSAVPEAQTEQIPEAPKSLLETMGTFDEKKITITSKDSDGLEAVLVRNDFSRGEAKEILTGIGDNISGLNINVISIGDVFTFKNPEGGGLSMEFQRGEKPKQVITLAGANYTEGEDLEKEKKYTEGEEM